ncbi:MAG: hypothetical protein WBJ40_00965 [Methanoculleus sp.]
MLTWEEAVAGNLSIRDAFTAWSSASRIMHGCSHSGHIPAAAPI